MLCWLWTCGVKLTDKRNKTKVDVSFSHYTAAKKTTTGKVEDKDSINLRCSNGVHGASQSCFCPDVQISFFLLPCRHKSWNLVFICSYYMMAYRISLCFLLALRRLSNYTTTFPWAERVTLSEPQPWCSWARPRAAEIQSDQPAFRWELCDHEQGVP